MFIDAHDQHRSGTPWPSKNDGRVVVRTLLQQGVLAPVAGDAKIQKYISEYSAEMRA